MRSLIFYTLLLLMWAIAIASAYVGYRHFMGLTGVSSPLNIVFGICHMVITVYTFVWPIRVSIRDGWPHTW